MGGVLEFLGIIAVAWPDLLPLGERLSSWLGTVYRRTVSGVRGLFGRPPLRHTVEVSAAMSAVATCRAAVVKEVDEEATLEARVSFLLQRDQEAQEVENRLSARLDDLDSSMSKQLTETRSRLQAHFAEKLAEELHRYRPLRILGTIALATGLCFTIAAGLL